MFQKNVLILIANTFFTLSTIYSCKTIYADAFVCSNPVDASGTIQTWVGNTWWRHCWWENRNDIIINLHLDDKWTLYNNFLNAVAEAVGERPNYLSTVFILKSSSIDIIFMSMLIHLFVCFVVVVFRDHLYKPLPASSMY